WGNISLIMRNKPGIDNLNIDDLYNNLKVYEADIKGSSRSFSNSQNVAFIFAECTSSTNELNVAYNVSTTTGHSSQAQGSSSYAGELMFSFFANQSSSPQLDNKDLNQIDQDDLEEMDLKWQVAMLSMRVKRLYKKIRRKLDFNGKEPVGFDKTKVECFNCHGRGHFASDCRKARNPGNKGRIKDAKTLWAAIKTTFGGNAESRKMQKNVLRQQFKNFYVSNSEGLEKGYDRFQRLLSLLEIHEAGVST
nr:ribonuclease H-like domain-containing protein [Tanacetum cinerariifolium]